MPDNRKTPLPRFKPVPRQRRRRDGWTPERQRRFIAGLAEGDSVRVAANAVGMTPEGAYQLRRQPGAADFAAAWAEALATAARATPPPRLPLLSDRGMLLILATHARRQASAEETA